ncbi:hypothetical protein [Streptomyces sp. NPDC000133]|uniref:hypothetical protein n=1 Tax=Streptomyces sp. NPDC000133 TaxID=3364535 RepID=UPI0036C6BEA7
MSAHTGGRRGRRLRAGVSQGLPGRSCGYVKSGSRVWTRGGDLKVAERFSEIPIARDPLDPELSLRADLPPL